MNAVREFLEQNDDVRENYVPPKHQGSQKPMKASSAYTQWRRELALHNARKARREKYNGST